MTDTDLVLGSFDSLWHYGLHAPPPPLSYSHEVLTTSLHVSLQSLFALLDEDRDGRLSLREIHSLLARLRLCSSPQDQNENDLLCALLQSILSPAFQQHTSSSHAPDLPSLDFPQFTLLYCSLFAGSQNDAAEDTLHDDDLDDELLDAFRIYDMDGDGFISATELAAVLIEFNLLSTTDSHHRGGEPHVARCQSYISTVDLDGDGMVDLEEFKAMMMASRSSSSRIALLAH